MKYTLKRSIGVDAQAAGEELERINEKHSGLHPEHVVKESKPKTATLHACFTWDDAKAGEQWRLQEARGLIRCVHVVSEDGEDQGAAFVNVSVVDPEDESSSHAYLPVGTVVADADLFASAVSGLTAKMAGIKRSLSDLYAQSNKRTAKRHLKRALTAAETVQTELGAL